MPVTDSSLERRVEELTRRIDVLTEEFARLSARVSGLPEGVHPPPLQYVEGTPQTAPPKKSKKDQSITTVLSTIATVSFLLVIALILRTIVDNGAVNPQFGSYLGMLYAGLLLAHSFRRYSRGHPHVPVYSTCGALLIFSIVYESQSRFNTLSAPVAYAILMATLVAMSVLGLRFIIPTALTIGALGASLVGLALEFPNPHFVWLAALVLLANFVAHYGRRIPQCRWLRWATLLVAVIFWSLWTTKVRSELIHGRMPPAEMALPWMLPTLAAFMVAYVALAARSVSRAKLSYGMFECILPVVNVLLGFAVAFRLATAGWGTVAVTGAIGVCVAVFHFGLAFLFARQGENGARAAAAFTFAAATLLALALPATPIDRLLVLGGWSFSALAIGFVSGMWANRGARLVAYLLQFFACGTAVALAWLAVATPLPKVRLAAVVGLALACYAHYVWSRYRAPAPQEGVIAAWDSADRAAVGLFFVALVYGFAAARIALYAWLPEGAAAVNATFLSGQSVLINASALLLLLWGVRRNNSEILGVAFAVALIGSLKVFGYDFLKIQGLQLVVSVFSFGVTAGVGSLVWRRRQASLE